MGPKKKHGNAAATQAQGKGKGKGKAQKRPNSPKAPKSRKQRLRKDLAIARRQFRPLPNEWVQHIEDLITKISGFGDDPEVAAIKRKILVEKLEWDRIEREEIAREEGVYVEALSDDDPSKGGSKAKEPEQAHKAKETLQVSKQKGAKGGKILKAGIGGDPVPVDEAVDYVDNEESWEEVIVLSEGKDEQVPKLSLLSISQPTRSGPC